MHVFETISWILFTRGRYSSTFMCNERTSYMLINHCNLVAFLLLMLAFTKSGSLYSITTQSYCDFFVPGTTKLVFFAYLT